MSRTKRTNAVLVSLMLAFVLTLGAGVVVGMAAGRHTPVGQLTPVTTRSLSRNPVACLTSLA